MKRAILGFFSFVVLCALAYYSGYWYMNEYYKEHGTIVDRKEELVPIGTPIDTLTEEMQTGGENQDEAAQQPENQNGTHTGTGTEAELAADQLRETSLPPGTIEAEIQATDGENVEYSYYLVEEFGYVNIYRTDLETVYEYTDISIDDLPQELQDEICTGKGLTNEQELYDFLENYSS